jgi:hypothetical protein
MDISWFLFVKFIHVFIFLLHVLTMMLNSSRKVQQEKEKDHLLLEFQASHYKTQDVIPPNM